MKNGIQEDVKLLSKVLAGNKLVVSCSEARRLIQQGAVRIDDEPVSKTDTIIRPGVYRVRIGKHKTKTIVV